jgi:hypothetical protein
MPDDQDGTSDEQQLAPRRFRSPGSGGIANSASGGIAGNTVQPGGVQNVYIGGAAIATLRRYRTPGISSSLTFWGKRSGRRRPHFG